MKYLSNILNDQDITTVEWVKNYVDDESDEEIVIVKVKVNISEEYRKDLLKYSISAYDLIDKQSDVKFSKMELNDKDEIIIQIAQDNSVNNRSYYLWVKAIDVNGFEHVKITEIV